MKNLVQCKNVYYSFTKDFNVLHNINFNLELNEQSVIIASSDSGIKSFIKVLLRDEVVNKGEVLINNIPIKKTSYKKDIFLAYLPIEPVFFEKKTVKYNLQYFLKLHKIKHINVLDICKKFKLNANEIVKNLSYYNRLKLAIARFSIRKIQLLIIEDIFKNLKENEGLIILAMLNDIITKCSSSVILTVSKNSKILKNLNNFTVYTLDYGTLKKLNKIKKHL